MRMIPIASVVAFFLCGSAAPIDTAVETLPAPDPRSIRTVRICVADLLDAEIPMCIERQPVRLSEVAALMYAERGLLATVRTEVAGTKPGWHVTYVAEVCTLMPDRGFLEPSTPEERKRHCQTYALSK